MKERAVLHRTSPGIVRAVAVWSLCAALPGTIAKELFRDDFNGTELDTSTWWCPFDFEHGRTRTFDCPSVSGGYAAFEHHLFHPGYPGTRCLSQEIQTIAHFPRTNVIEFEARVRVRTPIGNGLVASFFTYMDEAVSDAPVDRESDEIDFEFLTNQINWSSYPADEGDWVAVATYDDFRSEWSPDPYHHQEANPFVRHLDLAQFTTFKMRCWSDRTEWYWQKSPWENVRIFATTDALADEPMAVVFNFWAADFDPNTGVCNWPLACDPNLRPASDAAGDVVAYYDVDYVVVNVWSPADFNFDDYVDASDFARFQGCFDGPNCRPAWAECATADFDRDQDVDFADFATFQGCFSGPEQALPGADGTGRTSTGASRWTLPILAVTILSLA